jgi:hypothetical protein
MILEHLKLVNKNRAIVVHGLQSRNVVDYLQRYDTIYPGSFNPPHLAHFAMAQGCLPELTINHMFKGSIPYDDLAHRITMMNLMGLPVLVTDAQSFRDKWDIINSYVQKQWKYRVSDDALADCVSDSTLYNSNFLFQVSIRSKHHPAVLPANVDIEYIDIERPIAFSSEIRNRLNDKLLNPIVAAYIRKHGLYD